jgi:hypothetical protein
LSDAVTVLEKCRDYEIEIFRLKSEYLVADGVVGAAEAEGIFAQHLNAPASQCQLCIRISPYHFVLLKFGYQVQGLGAQTSVTLIRNSPIRI